MTEPDAQRLGPRACVFLLLLALAPRLAAIGYFGMSTIRFGDGPAYIFAAKQLLNTGRYPLATEPFYFRAPGYPLFLIAATLGDPDRVALAKIANAALGSLAVVLLAALSARVFRRRSLAFATGAAAALHPGLVSVSIDVASEPLFLLFLLSAGFLLLAAADRPSSNLAFLSGVALGLACLTRPSALVVAPLLAATVFDRRYPIRARSHLAASALLGLCFALFPWTLRNGVVYGELVPINDAAGSAFYQGNSDWTVRFYKLRNREEYERWSSEAFADLERETRAAERESHGSPTAKSRYFLRRTLAQRVSDPIGWSRLLVQKSWDWIRPYPSRLFWPPWVVWSTGLFCGALSIFAVAGLWAAPRPGVRVFVILYLLLTMAAHVVLIVVWRYRIVYWDPILLLYGIFGATRLLEHGSAVRRGVPLNRTITS